MQPIPQIVWQRWRELRALGTASDEAWDATLTELVARYRAPERHYHNLAHIAAMLRRSQENVGDLQDRGTVDLAIYFHDAVYDPHSARNEDESADLARGKLGPLGLHPEAIEKIARYIEATRHSAAIAAGNSDLDHLLDFDLAILAAAPAGYGAYARAIRQEYAAIPDAAYRFGRLKVLETFLASPRIFRVSRLAALWEAPARGNITTEIAGLRSPIRRHQR